MFPVIPVGIDETFQPEGSPPPAPPLRLLFVGDLLPEKGFDRILGALPLLTKRGVDFRLEVVGEGSLASLCPSHRRYGLEHRGAGEMQEIRAAMARSHLLLLPSRGEGTPLVVQEAIAMRLPVLATAVGGIPALYRSRRGWISLPPGDADSLAEIIEGLAAEGEEGVRRREKEMVANDNRDLLLARSVDLLAGHLREAVR